MVDSVAVEGTIFAERADFSVEYGITLRSQGPVWVPLRLDEQTVTGASEAERLLPLRAPADRGRSSSRGPARTGSASR